MNMMGYTEKERLLIEVAFDAFIRSVAKAPWAATAAGTSWPAMAPTSSRPASPAAAAAIRTVPKR